MILWAPLSAQAPDYFPLHPGNQWIYRCSGLCGEPLAVLGVTQVEQVGMNRYSLLEGFGGRRTWLRQDENGRLWALDRGTGEEKLWYSFFTPEGISYDTSLDPCSRKAMVASRNASHEGPAGKHDGLVQIVYPGGPCSDAGLSEELFLQWTGLLRRTETTFAGPRTYELIYARIGGVTVISQPELHFSLSLDHRVYTANLMPPVDPNASVPQMTARLSMRNSTSHAVPLTYPSGQRYDFELKNERGDMVYRWSDGKAFTMVFGEEQFGPGERNYVVVVRLADKVGAPFPAGRYTATGWITTAGQRLYSASVGFEIRHVH